jgi:hypothetical protein
LTGAEAQVSPRPPSSYTAVAQGFKMIDVKPRGPGLGDQILESGSLLGADGRRAGHYQLSAQLVAGTTRKGGEESAMTLMLAGGELALAGGHPTSDRFALPVVGGTGSYAGARGEARFAPAPHDRVKLVVALQ